MSRFPSTNPYEYLLSPNFFYMETPNKLTKQDMIDKIKNITYHRAFDTLTICVLLLQNGFTVVGQSACVDPANFDAEIGRRIAYDDAVEKLWVPEGYLLKEKLFREEQEKEMNRIREMHIHRHGTTGTEHPYDGPTNDACNLKAWNSALSRDAFQSPPAVEPEQVPEAPAPDKSYHNADYRKESVRIVIDLYRTAGDGPQIDALSFISECKKVYDWLAGR